MCRWHLLVSLAVITVIDAHREKRQLSIDDLISRALSLVRPIFDTSQPLQYEEMLKKQPVPSTDELRESIILGSRTAHPLENIPLCKGSSSICQFISCSAENFKKDPTFGNIQLAAQVLSDKKLRQTISSNPEAIDAVCKEQGMNDGECKLFSNGFQLIDKFITTIESKSPVRNDDPPRSLPARQGEHEQNDNVVMDDVEYRTEFSQQRPKALGSKTWSSQPDQGPQLFEIRNDMVASLTPLPTAPFIHPTPPSSPPLAFPTVPSLMISPISFPTSPIDKLFQMKIDPIIRRQRDIDFDTVDVEPDFERNRVRRDYYDDVQNNPADSSPSPSGSEHYDGSVVRSKPKHNELSSPLKNCVHMLGIY